LKKTISLILISLFLLSLLSIVIPNTAIAATTEKFIGMITYPTSSDSVLMSGVVFSKNTSLQPKSFTIYDDMKKVKKIEIVDPNDGNIIIESISPNPSVKTYTPKIVNGKKRNLIKKDVLSGPNGGVFAWNRFTSGAWKFEAGTLCTEYPQNICNRPGYGPLDKWGLPTYPSLIWYQLKYIINPPSRLNILNDSGAVSGDIDIKYAADVKAENVQYVEILSGKYMEPKGKIKYKEGGAADSVAPDNKSTILFQEIFDYVPEDTGHFASELALFYNYHSAFKIDYKGIIYQYPVYRIKITVEDGGGCQDPNGCGPPPPPQCTGNPMGSVESSPSEMTPNVSGKIRADKRGSEQFDVLQGIPTSESLYANVLAKEYLYKNKFVQWTGKCIYPVKVTKTYELTWKEKKETGTDPKTGKPIYEDVDMSDSETVSKEYKIERPFYFWMVDNLEVYGIDNAMMENYALPSESIVLFPNGYTPPSISVDHDGSLGSHVEDADYEQTVDLGTETVSGTTSKPSIPNQDFKADAEKVVGKVKVKNDSLTFNGSTIMDDTQTEEKTPAPGKIPDPKEIGQDVLYESELMIDREKVNQANTPSTGSIQYELIESVNGGAPQTFPINGINTVTVHTPTVVYAAVSDDAAHNQKTIPLPGRSAVILDRPFTVTIPTSGQHRNIPGYGNRDYAKYISDKQVWFPFDVYSGNRSVFYPKQTWISIPVNQEITEFFLPVWVDEGNYNVLFRSFAENSPSSGFTTQPDANLDWPNHVATRSVPVEVIGRVYDFRITDIADFNWETVFRTEKGSTNPTGAAYWVGDRDIDGDPRGNSFPYILPVREGSHPNPTFKNVAVKTGYRFSFDLKTKGNMFGAGDGIRIVPTFYYIGNDGKNRQEVDLYYHTNEKKFIKIGSPDDTIKRYTILSDPYRNLTRSTLTDTADALWNLPDTQRGSSTREQYIERYFKNAAKPTWIGGYSKLLLTWPVRTFEGSTLVPPSVDPLRAFVSEQMWYGEYTVPAAAYVVAKGTNLAEYGRTHKLDDKSPIFLRNGYMIVNFNIETIRNEDAAHPHLQYIHGPLDNQWQMEGFRNSFTDRNGKSFALLDGDVLFYNANASSYDDFESRVTH